jgi:hypothetical protein
MDYMKGERSFAELRSEVAIPENKFIAVVRRRHSTYHNLISLFAGCWYGCGCYSHARASRPGAEDQSQQGEQLLITCSLLAQSPRSI